VETRVIPYGTEQAKVDRRLPGQLSGQQISDAFRPRNFRPEEVEGFTKKVREKINELQQL
jgi:hypothetical protein